MEIKISRRLSDNLLPILYWFFSLLVKIISSICCFQKGSLDFKIPLILSGDSGSNLGRQDTKKVHFKRERLTCCDRWNCEKTFKKSSAFYITGLRRVWVQKIFFFSFSFAPEHKNEEWKTAIISPQIISFQAVLSDCEK